MYTQTTSQNQYHGKNPFKKDKGKTQQTTPTGKWCDYHSSTWHDAYECKNWNTIFIQMSTSELGSTNKSIVEIDIKPLTLLESTSITFMKSTIIDGEER